MNTPTPRTDEAWSLISGDTQLLQSMKNLSHELERELTAITEQRDKLAEALRKAISWGDSASHHILHRQDINWTYLNEAKEALQSLTQNKTIMQEEQYNKIDEDGNKCYYKDKRMTNRHRVDGPAVEAADGSKVWYVDGKLHRLDGPAIEAADGYKAWYVDGKRHRLDGSAIEHTVGDKAWYVDGKRHRLDGPAVEWADGYKSWWVDGKRLSEHEFNALSKPLELTLDQIAAKFGVDVKNLKIVK